MLVKRHFAFLAVMAAVLIPLGALGVAQITSHNNPQIAIQPHQLPEISFYDKSGKSVTLEDFKGKVVLVNLWATWCLPCAAEMASLDRLQAKLPQDKFRVVAISVDRSSLKTVETFMQKRALGNLDVYWDQNREVPLKWQYEGLPTSFLLDRQGTIIARYDGPYHWDEAPLLKDIGDRLAK